MVDDHTQRPYRSNDTIARASAKPAASSGSDPLAELARLIGQNDPFSEYGRASAAPQAGPAAPAIPAPQYDHAASTAAALLPPMPGTRDFPPPNFPPPNIARQPFGGASLAAGSDMYPVETDPHGFPAAAQDGGYEDDGYHPDQHHPGGEEQDYYEDVPSSRRRMSIMVIAGIFALAVIGTAGAFGYRALFGSSGANVPPPVIKAETAPSKIVPASNRDTSNKQITDRVNDRAQGEKLVSREEQPVDLKDKAAAVAFPPAEQANAAMPAPGSGVVSPDAKRVRTIAIHPDQSMVAEAMPTSSTQPPAAAAAPLPPVRTTMVAPPKQATPPAPAQQQAPPQRTTAPAPAADPDDAEQAVTAPKRATPARVPPAVAQHQAAAPANAPLSLNPDAPAPKRATPQRAGAPARTAAAPATQTAPAAGGSGGSYAVQVSSQRSEAEAQAAFRGLQGRYPGQLGGKQPLIHKVDLGEKGIYYRAMVGPFATGAEATQLCSSLKAAGGQCIIQKN